ncbi:modulator of macroautophagy TMEM150B-like isoform X2 [Engraulis encrasicolus]|uniref:modulator of macroautophagy TMEM150B-like isoform X2 n=1 Tax=Engraulis encrasicolus TaxID=184585 RepID=UPI002FD3DB9A
MWTWTLLPVLLTVTGIVGTWIVQCAVRQPESSLFCVFCNVWTFLIVWVVVIRYQLVRELSDSCCRGNLSGLVLGLLAAAGVTLLGSFPMRVFFLMHLLGAYLAFFVGVAFFWVQLWLTYQAEPSHDRCWTGPLRASLCSLCTSCLLGMFVLKAVGLRDLAAMSEWAMVFLFFLLFGTFAIEFRHIHRCHATVLMQGGSVGGSDDVAVGWRPVV